MTVTLVALPGGRTLAVSVARPGRQRDSTASEPPVRVRGLAQRRMVAVTLSERLRCRRAGGEDKVLYINSTAGGAVDHDWVDLLSGLDVDQDHAPLRRL